MMQGETVGSGAPIPEGEVLHVMQSPAGYFLGFMEDGQPYSRETDYFGSAGEAQILLSELLAIPPELWQAYDGVRY